MSATQQETPYRYLQPKAQKVSQAVSVQTRCSEHKSNMNTHGLKIGFISCMGENSFTQVSVIPVPQLLFHLNSSTK